MFAYHPAAAPSFIGRRPRATYYEDQLEQLRRQAAIRAYQEEVARQEHERRVQQAHYEARLRRELAERQAYEEALEREAYRRELERRCAFEQEALRRHRQQQQRPIFVYQTSSAPQPARPRPSTEQVKHAAVVIQRRYRAHRSTLRHLQELATIRAEMNKLSDDFVKPDSLEFDLEGKLTFTPANAAVHGYEDRLTRLLTRLDAVESEGSESVRAGRKAIVRDIEAILADLDELKAQALAASTKTVSVPITSDSDVEDAPANEAAPANEVVAPSELSMEEPVATAAPDETAAPVVETEAMVEDARSPSLHSLPDDSDDEVAGYVMA